MKFKNFEDYKAQRDALLDVAQTLLNDGKMEEYRAKTKEVKELDAAYEEFAQEQANIAALQGAVRPPLSAAGRTGVIESMNMDDGMGYRKAFMNYVISGTPITMSNSDATTMASDVGAVIPNTIMERIIEKIETTGNILARVTRTYYKGGVSVPTSAAKPTATWTTERGTTDKQNKVLGSITFNYYKLKIQIATSIIVENVTLDIFENTIASNIAEAIIKALEEAIINGTGSGQPKGILAETALTGQVIEFAGALTYADICNAEGALPSAYDDAVWCMKKSTYMGQVAAMVDANGQPIARVNAGMNGKPEYTILGRPVEFSDNMPSYNGSGDATIAFLFRFEDYMLNTNMDVTVSRYTDHDTDDEVTKAIMLADGKVIDLNSLVLVNAKNS